MRRNIRTSNGWRFHAVILLLGFSGTSLDVENFLMMNFSNPLGNFINLPYSLAKRHQEGLCYRINTPEGSHSTFLEKGNEIGPGKEDMHV